MTTNDSGLMRTLGIDGVGLIYTIEPLVADEIARGRLRVVLEPYLTTVPGLFPYFPSRAQIGSCRRAREAKHPCKERENGSASDVFSSSAARRDQQ